jgi:hypothetical protein
MTRSSPWMTMAWKPTCSWPCRNWSLHSDKVSYIKAASSPMASQAMLFYLIRDGQ